MELQESAVAQAARTNEAARAQSRAVVEEAELRAQEIIAEASGEAAARLAAIQAETREALTRHEQAQQAVEWQAGRLRSGADLMAQMATEMEELATAAEGIGEPT